MPDTGDCPRCRVVFEKPLPGSEKARQAGRFAAIAFYVLMNRKLQAGRRNRRTERPRVRARPRAFRAREPGSAEATHLRGPAAEARRSGPRALAPGPGAPFAASAGLLSCGADFREARPRAPRSRRRGGRPGQTCLRGPETLGFPRPWALHPCSPAPLPTPGPRAGDRGTPRRGGGGPHGAAEAGPGGGDGGMPAEPGLAGCPPSRGDRGLSSLLRLLKSSFPGESGDVRGPASRWRGCPAGEAASSYPITDCQSHRPSPRLPGVAGTITLALALALAQA